MTSILTKPRLFTRKVFLFIGISLVPAFSVELSAHDSLKVEVIGGAAISFLHGAGQKAAETGLLKASLDHIVSENVHAICAVRGSRNSLQSFIEEADIRWKSGRNRIDIGFVSHRYGYASCYRETSPFYFLFDKPLLWDANGFGFTYLLDLGANTGLVGASSVNTRENGQAHALLSMNLPNVESRLLGSFETYSSENQDNGIATGLEVNAHWERLKIHGIGKYTNYLGYGHAANPTMVPGESIVGFLELTSKLTSCISASAVSYALNTRKRFDHQLYFEGLELTWMFVNKFGCGGGCEWQQDDGVVSLMPRLFAKAVPSPDHAGIEVSFQPTIINRAIISYRVSGEIWIKM